jgi:serine/threonine protein phosphatase 1
MQDSHLELLTKAKLYHEQDNKLFVHAGITEGVAMKKQSKDTLIWTRSFIQDVKIRHIMENATPFGKWDNIYIGHTPVLNFADKSNKSFMTPQLWCNVWAIDTGASYHGPLTLMNVNTNEIFQSKAVKDLYPGMPNR